MEWKKQYAEVVRNHIGLVLLLDLMVKFYDLGQMYMDQQSNIQSRKIDQLISREKLAEAIIEHDLPIGNAIKEHFYCGIQKVYFREKEKLKQVLAKIPNRENSSNLDEVMKDMAARMFNKFQKYWNRYSLVLSFGAILDPRFKMQLLEYCFSKVNSSSAEAQAATIKLKLYKLYEQYANNQIGATAPTTWSKPTEEGSQSKQKKSTLFAEFKEFEGTLVCIAGKSELDLYLEKKKLDYQTFHEMDVIKYWKDNEKKYLDLSIMARDVLSVPITTVASELAFSIGDEDELLK
ncbi:hypothetical protein KY290_026600 [Solanum tuberosum]|uniref:Uncharacterized protein n=1 Tax=Solanum tuberosum TaxID=4113 RepID=A0ABQ7UWW7_SOLTU|nr:hypothetical protein KY284_023520 [Solanum tuberosum]KAH0756330.1 hypothetical protein KY290_026600 [Solanum tuberosum]